jgi:hypothetical protein
MARARVATARFRAGGLPPVCAKTGEVADGWVVVHADRLPGWIFLLLLCGVLPFLIALAFASQQVSGLVPLGARANQRLRRGRMIRWAMLLLGLALVAVALVSASRVAWWAVSVLLVGALVVYLLEVVWSVGGRLEADGEHVTLTGIHPAFRSALRADTAREPAGLAERHQPPLP